MSLSSPQLPEREVGDAEIAEWDPIWVEVNAEFEQDLQESGWGHLSNKMFYVWDGNHRLYSWKADIKKCKSHISLIE